MWVSEVERKEVNEDKDAGRTVTNMPRRRRLESRGNTKTHFNNLFLP
jgi:hypothetical protein